MVRKGMPLRRSAAVILVLTLALGSAPPVRSQQRAQAESSRAASVPGAIPAAEFSRLIQEFSEEGGSFQSDNFTSNETSYLDIVGRLREMGISGGAYVGVGPEQNFTYIAKIRPRIAFIVDIRRQAMIQHLLYKAVFHLAEDPAQFLSWLFSKPLSKTRSETKGSLEDLLRYILEAPTTQATFLTNLAAIRKTIEQDFAFPLSPEDAQSLEYIYKAFWQDNLRIRYGAGSPYLEELILEADREGKRGNFLAQADDYQFVRQLQEENRVIPVVGDFGGTKALAAVAEYLRENGYTVSAFYTSNVEEYLYWSKSFRSFAENVGKLPLSGRSVIIRALRSGFASHHPASLPGATRMTLLQKISVFLEDFSEGFYRDYWNLVTTHYISAAAPNPNVSPIPVSR